MSCGEGSRQDTDPGLLWLWRRLAAAALIQPLAWERPYAAGAALKSKNKTKQNKSNYNSLGHCGSKDLIPSLAQWVKGSGIAAAVVYVTTAAQIHSLAQELPYAECAAIKK